MSACKKQWDQRDKVTNQKFDVNLMQQIKANPNLSTFARFLAKGGYDKILSSSKNFTVWAPTNDSFQGVDTNFVAAGGGLDTAKLHRFLGNHIVNQTYLTTNIEASARIRTLNGKFITITSSTAEDAHITAADDYVGNGVLNVIDKVLVPKMNIDEYITSLSGSDLTLQKQYIRSQDSTYTDTASATVQSIDPVTGNPILVPGTGIVKLNKYYNKVGNLASEDSTYTYFILNDAAYTAETNKVKPFFTTVSGSADTTAQLAAYNVLKDVMVKGKISQANLAATLTSVMGKPVPVNSGAVVSSYEASNGMVYVVNSMNFDLHNKIDTITIQGEQPSFYMRTDQAGTSEHTLFRTYLDNNGVKYHDLYISGQNISGTGIAKYFAGYKISNLNTCKYQVVIRAYNDTLVTHIPATTSKVPNPFGDGVIQENVAFGPTVGVTVNAGSVVPIYNVTFDPFNVEPFVYEEREIVNAKSTGTITTINASSDGKLNVIGLRSVNMYVIGANLKDTNLNNILVDYIKLIPIIN